MRGAGVGEAALYLLPTPATCYLPVATHNALPLYRAPDEAQLSAGRRRSLKAVPGWRKASSAAPTRTRTRPDPGPNPIPGEFGGEYFCGHPRHGAPEREPGRWGGECGRSTQGQRRGVLLPFTPTPTATPEHLHLHPHPHPNTATPTDPTHRPLPALALAHPTQAQPSPAPIPRSTRRPLLGAQASCSSLGALGVGTTGAVSAAGAAGASLQRSGTGRRPRELRPSSSAV